MAISIAVHVAGERARSFLTGMVHWRSVTCQPRSARDKYGRVVACCSVPQILALGRSMDLSAVLVNSGHALAYRCAADACMHKGAASHVPQVHAEAVCFMRTHQAVRREAMGRSAQRAGHREAEKERSMAGQI